MKRLTVFLIGILIAGTLEAQQSNTFKYEIKALGGLTIGPTATANKATITSWILDGNLVKIYNGATQYSFATAAADQIDLNTVFVKLQPDTLLVTDVYTLLLTDANKLITVTKATSVAITIPTNATAAIPIGTTINFVQGGAGKIVFKGAFHSKLDSTATGGIWSWAALYKRGTNNWLLYGDISD